MAVVWIPAQLRTLASGRVTVSVAGSTVGEVIAALEIACPGIRERLCDGDRLRPSLSVAVDDEIARLGLLQPVRESSEVHFLPAISGG